MTSAVPKLGSKIEDLQVESEVNARFAGGFGLAGSLGYIDAQYDEYITNIANVPTDVADFRVAGASFPSIIPRMRQSHGLRTLA